jgi:Uma2 family endonuclease
MIVMSLPQTIARYTVEEYLALERESEERHEFLDGQIYAMAGESNEHADISVNLVRELSSQLKGTPCRVWTKDSKVLSGPAIRSYKSIKGLFSYPDIVVVCGEPRFLDEHRDVLLNPNLIIEVLSPSTESFDRGEKFWRYRTHLASLTDYVQVSQALPLIEHFRRQANDQWILTTVSEMTGSLSLESINCTLRMSEVYDRVTFPEEKPEAPASEQ